MGKMRYKEKQRDKYTMEGQQRKIQDKRGCDTCKYINKRDKDKGEMRGYVNKIKGNR